VVRDLGTDIHPLMVETDNAMSDYRDFAEWALRERVPGNVAQRLVDFATDAVAYQTDRGALLERFDTEFRNVLSPAQRRTLAAWWYSSEGAR